MPFCRPKEIVEGFSTPVRGIVEFYDFEWLPNNWANIHRFLLPSLEGYPSGAFLSCPYDPKHSILAQLRISLRNTYWHIPQYKWLRLSHLPVVPPRNSERNTTTAHDLVLKTPPSGTSSATATAAMGEDNCRMQLGEWKIFNQLRLLQINK